jgi:23S rRNA (cytosine1962-C5)-methyltransferase
MKIERNQASVSKKGANRIRDGHLWIFKSDVLGVNAEGGSIVTVLDERRKFLGKALYSDKSEITFRFLTTQDVRIDKDWWRERIVTAVKRREHYRRGANAARLVYSEGDLLPSLIIDFYDDTFVLQTLSQGADKLKSVFSASDYRTQRRARARA